MEFDFLKSPWHEEFFNLLRQVRSNLIISSPYIGLVPCKKIIDIYNDYKLIGDISILIVTDLSKNTLLSGATDQNAICCLDENFRKIEIRFLPSIHAKIYVADDKLAIITSSNMTNAGLYRNFEYGIKINDSNMVNIIKNDLIEYALLGTKIEYNKLQFLSRISSELNSIRDKAERSIKRELYKEFETKLNNFDDEIIRLRAAGRTPHAIFADAILYFLKQRPMTTAELQPMIQKVHSDFCDYSMDRIIDGRHFGKKWKHAVRTAQQHLKRKGIIEFKDGIWRLSNKNY